MALAFNKYQGLGNDFIVVDAASPNDVDAAVAQRLCDRHFGVGADGVLLISPSQHADAKLVIINADGSRPEMCGNGLRCVALHLERTRGPQAALRVETDAGTLGCSLFDREGERWVTLSLGRAERIGELSAPGPRGTLTYRRIAVGNPHAVLLGHDLTSEEIDVFGPQLSAQIPGGANVEFVRAKSRTAVEVVVWERGVGRTLACGTGAGATVVAAAFAEWVPFDVPVVVTLPGGDLEVSVRQSDLEVTLSGPARHVFAGVAAL